MEYFTPSVEDIRVGYECEVDLGKGWEDIILKGTSTINKTKEGTKIIIISDIKTLIAKNLLRVPYLTKEQIEAEGWIDDEEKGHVKGTWNVIQIDLIYDGVISRQVALLNDGVQMFVGECKDINTFRWICKLLAI